MAPQPIYLTVLQHLRKQVSQGRLKPGSRMPSENEIVRQFGISRMTANRVLSLLAAQGVVTRVAGVGTFVAAPPGVEHTFTSGPDGARLLNVHAPGVGFVERLREMSYRSR